eukprot:15455640-Alexandrium_andersonii.AAC.1
MSFRRAMTAAFARNMLCAAAALVATACAADCTGQGEGLRLVQASCVSAWALEAALHDSRQEAPAQLL